MFDHVQTEPVPTDEITFEAFTGLSALAAETARVRLGHLVLCAGYRNPALVAKMISTLDVVSGGRAELGLGAGWKEDEYLAYGFGFPPLRTRMEMLEDALEIATRMLGGGRATYEGPAARVRDAINVPRGLQEPRIPILVGGNGPNRTWRLAARFADELNLDWFTPEEIVAARPVIASRCEEIGRDPATLRLSVNIGREDSVREGDAAGRPAAALRGRGRRPGHDADPGLRRRRRGARALRRGLRRGRLRARGGLRLPVGQLAVRPDAARPRLATRPRLRWGSDRHLIRRPRTGPSIRA